LQSLFNFSAGKQLECTIAMKRTNLKRKQLLCKNRKEKHEKNENSVQHIEKFVRRYIKNDDVEHDASLYDEIFIANELGSMLLEIGKF
jgi:ribosomal protein L31E